MSPSDRLQKVALLRVPRSRVWRALTDAEQFGAWFRAKLDGPFVPGRPTTGRITHPGYEHLRLELLIDRIDAEEWFSFRWHPYAVEMGVDYSGEPTTRVEFHLEEVVEGTLLTVVESGFDALPAARRDVAFRMNGQGWAAQLENVRHHVEG